MPTRNPCCFHPASRMQECCTRGPSAAQSATSGRQIGLLRPLIAISFYVMGASRSSLSFRAQRESLLLLSCKYYAGVSYQGSLCGTIRRIGMTDCFASPTHCDQFLCYRGQAAAACHSERSEESLLLLSCKYHARSSRKTRALILAFSTLSARWSLPEFFDRNPLAHRDEGCRS